MPLGRLPLRVAAVSFGTVVLLGLAAAPANPGSGLAARRAALAGGLHQALAAVDARVKRGEAVTTRDLAYAAETALAVDGDAATAERFLALETANQVMDPARPDYGELPWQTGVSTIHDANAIEFGTESWGPILLEFGNRLSPAARASLEEHARAAIPALRRHQADISYDNIILMKAASLLLLGRAAGDASAEHDGAALLRRALAYDKRFGLHEFDAPTYYAVDLSDLETAYRLTGGDDHATIAALLDLYWRDVAAHWSPVDNRLIGAHARDYDFVHGDGDIERRLWLEGIAPEPAAGLAHAPVQMVLDYVGSGPGRYEEHAFATPAFTAPRRVVVARYGEDPFATTYTYVAPGLAVGSAGLDYIWHDKLVAVDFASRKRVAQTSIVVDTADDPYGHARIVPVNGHRQVWHEALHPAIAQRGGTLVVLGVPDPPASGSIASYETSVLIPSDADAIAVDGTPVTPAVGLAMPLTTKSVVTVREGDAVEAIRVFRADACDGGDAPLQLRAEESGLKAHALRIVAVHYAGAEKTLTCHRVRFGALIDAASGVGTAGERSLRTALAGARLDEETTQSSDTLKWRVAARIAAHTYDVAADVDFHRPLLRLVDGAPMPADTFNVVAGEVR
ncbi:MAG: hypothetical protein JOZ86_09835 [Candidatus Eremiobacteraeota bacterium]|nr:hypothetical protein [Candidatus Eremiobacteraeota bacterium]